MAVGLTVMLLTAGTGAAVLFARSDATALGALGLVLAGMAVHIVFMITQLAHSVVEFVRSLGDQGHVDRIIDHHWSVRALHADGEAGVGELVGATSGLTGGAALVADLRRVSSAAARAALERLPDTRLLPVSERSVLVLGAGARLSDPRARRISMVRGFLLLGMATLAGMVLSAVMIADAERAACGAACADRPADLANALYWLVSRVLPFEPDGIEAKTWGPRILGLAWTLYGPLVIGTGVNLLFQRASSRNESVGVSLVARFNAERDEEERTEERTVERDEAKGDEAAPKVVVPSAPLWFLAGAAFGLVAARIRRCSTRA